LKKATASAGNRKRAGQHAVFCDLPLQRPNYFAGRLLTVADLTAEQEYHQRKHRYHNLHFHGVGVVHGLKVSVANDKTGGTVVIQPGVAIDPAGNEVHLCATRRFSLPNSATEIQVGIRWMERLCGFIPAAGSEPAESASMPARVEEGCEVVLDPKATPQSSLARCSSGKDSVDVLPLARVVRRGKAWRLDGKFKVPRVR
jgi:hypothetical protein